jgi:hypothetical protein
MNRSRSIAYAFVLLTGLIVIGEAIVSLANGKAQGAGLTASSWVVVLLASLVPAAFTTVGSLVVTHAPGNRIGRLMIGIGVGFALVFFTSDYPGVTADKHHLMHPFGLYAAWVSTWIGALPLTSLFLLLLLFPTGALPGKRWVPVLWLGLITWIGLNLVSAVRTGPIDPDHVLIPNPFGFVPVPDAVVSVLTIGAIVSMVLAVMSLVLRFRSARGDTRQQLKWFTYGGVLAIAWNVAGFATQWSNDLVAAIWLASATGLPVFIGVAILRYRLYDIDVLINRTLVYGSLTLSLAGVYFGGVLVLQALTRALVGHSSDLSIAIATLGVAALFNPWRHRVQLFIDRRFYRRKYDAGRILNSLSARLRDDVDILAVSREIVAVVDETVHPSHVSLWVR